MRFIIITYTFIYLTYISCYSLSFSLQKLKKYAAITFTSTSIFNFPASSFAVDNALGSNTIFKDQSMVLQDISFRVPNVDIDSEVFLKLTQNSMKILRSTKNTKTLGFGADTLNKIDDFIPGVSSFNTDSGHATITLIEDQINNGDIDTDTTVITEKGNGIQFIKLGADLIRISKAIEAGAEVKTAYGYIDLDTPAGIPVQVVLGIRRDPLSYIALRVSNVKQSGEWLSNTLGMKKVDFDKTLSRVKGSDFEPQSELFPGSEYYSYSDDTMGVLLLASPKKAGPIEVGGLIDSIKIVVDSNSEDVPQPIKDMLIDANSNANTNSNTNDKKYLESPDGYRFSVQSAKDFEKTSTKKAPEFSL